MPTRRSTRVLISTNLGLEVNPTSNTNNSTIILDNFLTTYYSFYSPSTSTTTSTSSKRYYSSINTTNPRKARYFTNKLGPSKELRSKLNLVEEDTNNNNKDKYRLSDSPSPLS